MASDAQSPAFRGARNSIFHNLRAALQRKREGMIGNAPIFVKDHIPYEESDLTDIPNEKNLASLALLNGGVEILVHELVNHLDRAVAALLEGKSVYELLGASEIPTYKAITNGDQHAAELSAAEDFTILLLSLDSASLVQKVFDEVKASGGLDSEVEVILHKTLRYVAAVMRDELLRALNDNLLNALPVPQDLEYENGAVAPPALISRYFSKIVSYVIDHSNFDHSREAKLPKSWPPLRYEGNVQPFAPALPGPQPDSVLSSVPETPASLEQYDAMDFRTGYLETLLRFYHDLQEGHFAAVEHEKYPALTRHSVVHKARIEELAQYMINDLRERLRDHIQEPVKLSGVFSRGVLQACEDIKTGIALVSAPAGKRDPVSDVIVGRLKEHWNGLAGAVLRKIEAQGALYAGSPEYSPAAPF